MEKDFDFYVELLDSVALEYNNVGLMIAIHNDIRLHAMDLQDEIESDEVGDDELEDATRNFIEYRFEEILN